MRAQVSRSRIMSGASERVLLLLLPLLLLSQLNESLAQLGSR